MLMEYTKSTRFTTLIFVSDQCKKHKVEPVATFDQPLCWEIIILLGNSHTQMSFLWSVGNIMKNSSILELLSTAYALNSAKQSVGRQTMQDSYERS